MTKNTFEIEYLSKDKLKKYLKNPTLFQHPCWLRAIEEGLRYDYFGLLTYYNRLPISVSIFFKCKKGGILKLAGSPLPGSFTPYIEPIWLRDDCDDEIKVKVLLSQYHFLKKIGFSYIEQRFKTDKLVKKLLEFQNQNNYEISFPETFILDIEQNTDAMWKKMHTLRKRMIRKAQKFGLKIIRSEGTNEEIKIFYNMLKRVFSKSKMLPPHPLSLYKSIVYNLNQIERLLILSAVFNDKVIATSFFVYDNKMIYFLSGASSEEAYKTGANTLIHWEAIKFAVENGIAEYDLGGKGIPSIDKFKASFGGEVHRYGRVVLRSKTAFIAERLYRKFILFRDKLKTKIKA